MWTADNRQALQSRQTALSERPDRCGMGAYEPLIPPGKPGGGKRRVAIREVINGVMYILSTGCQWRALPQDLQGGEYTACSMPADYLGVPSTAVKIQPQPDVNTRHPMMLTVMGSAAHGRAMGREIVLAIGLRESAG